MLRIRVIGEKGKFLEDDRVSVHLTEPSLTWAQPFPLTELSQVWGSACVLPGLDPRGGNKACQDFSFIEVVQDILLAGEFDGHGYMGESVVIYCKRFAVSYLSAHLDQARLQPQEFLIALNEDCDEGLKKTVDCRISGCTAVILLYVSGTMYFSCVGDSRAVLATTMPFKGFTQPPRREDKELLDEIKVKRQISLDHTLTAEQVTEDQKPEDPEELARIQKAGGVVMRLEDEFGQKVGPYRVWKVEGMYPGIAMSRSLGDIIAQEIGVISTPVITTHAVNTDHDYFVVLASDGVWDVMENQEVCDFIEAFRNKSPRNVSLPQRLDVVEPGAVTISQLLCEEARARWLSVVEAEDVLIDDISCVIVEMKIVGERKRTAPKRTIPSNKETQDVPGLTRAMRRRTKPKSIDIQKDSLEPEAVVKDPRRSSISHYSPLIPQS